MKPYENIRWTGPYRRADKRLIIIVYKFKGRKKTTVSYPKYLMEVYLGRYLKENETVDHIDKNIHNNNLENLRILDRCEHVKIDIKRLKTQKFICPVCKIEFELTGTKLSNLISNRKRRNSSGPYCCKNCAGWDSNFKHRQRSKLNIEYTTLKDLNGVYDR